MRTPNRFALPALLAIFLIGPYAIVRQMPSPPAFKAGHPAGVRENPSAGPRDDGPEALAEASGPARQAVPALSHRSTETGRMENWRGRTVRTVERLEPAEGLRYAAIRVVERFAQDGALLHREEMAADQILVNLADNMTVEELARATGIPFTLRKVIRGTGTCVLAFPLQDAASVARAQAAVTAHPELIRYAEPDYITRVTAAPYDPRYTDGTLWGLNNTGQNGGTADADIDAPEGWNTRTSAVATINTSRAGRTSPDKGPAPLVIAVVDSGIRYTHEDIAANMWVNPAEIPGNGIDDDNNNVVDDVYGVNTILDNGDPMDDFGHGTHVAGTIAGEGNNGKGVAGVAWNARIAACKYIGANGTGLNSDAAEAIWYAWEQAGADIINCSWGGSAYSTEIYNQLLAAQHNGAIIVAAAGNAGATIDEWETYPAGFQLPNLVTVAATTRTDSLAGYSNYSYSLVNVAAPGDDILSLGNTGDSSYETMSGTSMAVPVVSGILAMIRAQYPDDTPGQAINRLCHGVDLLSGLVNKVQTGGRVNLQRSLAAANTPANDAFAGASKIPSSPLIAIRSANYGATTETGEPAHAGLAATRTVWFKWTAPSTGNFIVSTQGSKYSNQTMVNDVENYSVVPLDTVLAVYTGTSLGGLTAVASNNDFVSHDGSVNAWSRVTFAATAGTTYAIAVGAKPSASVREGMVLLSVSTPPANDDFANASAISGAPLYRESSNLNGMLETGEPLLHRSNVLNSGNQLLIDTYPDRDGSLNPGGASVWWKWTPSVTGNYIISTSGSAIDTVMGIYTAANPSAASFAQRNLALVAENDDIGLVRADTYVTFSAVRGLFNAGTTYYIQVDGYNGAQGGVALGVSVPPPNDNIASATVMEGNAWSALVNNIGASAEYGEPLHAGADGAVSVWYRWTAQSTQDYQLSMAVTTITTAYAVYTAANPASPVVTNLTEVASVKGLTGAGLRLPAIAGLTYFIAVDGVNGRQRDNMRLDLSPVAGAMTNDNFAERIPITGTSARVSSNTGTASFESGEPEKLNPVEQRSVWWIWTAPASGSVTFTTQYSSYNAAVGVYTGTALGALTEIAFNQPATGQGSAEYGKVTFQATRGAAYQIVVFGQASYGGPCTLNLSMAPANGLPSVTGAALSVHQAYADESISVVSVTTADPEGNPVSISYQWQSSPDRQAWSDAAGRADATLAASGANAGLFWRCRLRPSDATGDGNPYYTDAVTVLRRPQQVARNGQWYEFQTALPVASPAPEARRTVIINEFCKGAGTPASSGALNGEWYELLALRDVNLAGYHLNNVFRRIRFLDVPLWQSVPAGTLIVIYNPTNKHTLLPADVRNPADDGRIVVSGNDATLFDDGNGYPPTCPKLSGNGDTGSNVVGTGARIVVSRNFISVVDDISYHSVDHLGSDSQYKRTPHLPVNLGGGQTYRYTLADEDGCEQSAAWELGPATADFATPGRPNTQLQADWIARLRAPAPRYRLSAAGTSPGGLAIDPVTGLLAGTIDAPDGGVFAIRVERTKTGFLTTSQLVELFVVPARLDSDYWAPVAGTSLVGGTPRPSLAFRRPVAATDLTTRFEQSTDLNTWTQIDPAALMAGPPEPLDFATERITLLPPLPAPGQPPRYYRMLMEAD